MDKLKALEVTPDWNYTAQADEAQLSASHDSDAQLMFSQVSSTHYIYLSKFDVMVLLQLSRGDCVMYILVCGPQVVVLLQLSRGACV